MTHAITFLALTTLFSLSQAKTRELFYYNVSLIANEKYVNDSGVKIQCDVHTRERPCIYAPAVKFYLQQDLARVYVQVKAIDVIKNKVFFEQLLNLCLFENQALDVLIKVVVDKLKDHLSFPLKCPFKKGLYETFAFKQDFGIFLRLFPLNQPQHYATIIKGKIGKKVENIVKYNIDFEIVEVN